MGLGAQDEGPTGAIVKATTVIYLRAAETAASSRAHSRRGTATTSAEAGDKVTTSPRAALPASARARIFCTAAARGRAGSASPAQRPRRQPRLPASSSSRCSRVWRRRRRMLKTTARRGPRRRRPSATTMCPRCRRPRRPPASSRSRCSRGWRRHRRMLKTTSTSRQPPVVARRASAALRLAAPPCPSHAAHCWQHFSPSGRTYVR